MANSGTSAVRYASDNPTAELLAQVKASFASAPASTIGTRTRVIAVVTIAAGASAGIVLTASKMVYHRYAPGLVVQAGSVPHLMLALALLLALTVVATFMATRRGPHGLGSRGAALYLTGALVAPVYAALTLVRPMHAHAPPVGTMISPWGVRCLILSALVGSLVLTGLTAALRRSVPAASRLRGAAIGAAAGAWAGLSVFLFCPSGDLQHLFIGHVLPIVAWTVVGSVAIPRALRL